MTSTDINPQKSDKPFVINNRKENTMKIKVIISIMLLIGTMMISGCVSSSSNNEIEYVAYEAGGFDSLDGGSHLSEIPIWKDEKINFHQDSSAPKEAEVTFNGNTYSGVYMYSCVRRPNLYLSHCFASENVSFEINASTGELRYIRLPVDIPTDVKYNEEQCRKIADTIADDYINLNDYKVVRSGRSDQNKLFSFKYYKEINGFETSDTLTISVNSDGDVWAFGKYMLGTFNEISEISFDSEKINTVLESKIGTIYQNISNHIGYEIDSVTLMQLEDGSSAFLYTIENKFSYGNYESGSIVYILVAQQNSIIP